MGGGNTTFGGTGDFEGALTLSEGSQAYIITKRNEGLTFQGQSAGTAASIELYSADSDGTDDLGMDVFAIGTPASITDRERVRLKYDASETDFCIIYRGQRNRYVTPLGFICRRVRRSDRMCY